MTATVTDGRHARTDATRAKILAAWLDFYRATSKTPSTTTVAREAGVSVRAVHRCYPSMGALHHAGHEARLAELGITDRSQLDQYIWRLCTELRRKVDKLTPGAKGLTGPANQVAAASVEIAALAEVRDGWAS